MSHRTQIYLSVEQKKELDLLGRHQGRSMAELIREAVGRYLQGRRADPQDALEKTFGACRKLRVPDRAGWDRR